MQGIEIRTPRREDEEDLEALITSHFTEDSSYDVDLGIDDPVRHVRVAEGADGALLGVMAINLYEDTGTLVEGMHMFETDEHIPEADRYGHLQMGYVRDEATGRGIGSGLIERMERIGREHGVDCFLADSWYHGGDDSPELLFDRNGYETIFRDPIEDRTAAECPKCDPVCTCERAIAIKWDEDAE